MLVLLLIGCNVVDAPEDLEALMVYGFDNFDRDEEFLAATGTNLFPLVDAQFEAVAEGYRVNSLTSDNLVSAGIETTDVSSILGAMGAANYRHPIAEILVPVLADEERVEMFEQIKAYTVDSETGDRECFIAGDCDRYDFTATQTVAVPLLGDSTQTFDAGYRWIHPDEGDAFVVIRTLSPGGVAFDTDIMIVNQQYGLAVMFPFEGNARRVEAFWVDADIIGMDVPEYYAVEQAAKSMAEQAERVDDWLDSE